MPVTLVSNAIIQHKLGTLRKAETPPDTFRRIIGELSVQLFFEAASNLPFVEEEVQGPFEQTRIQQVSSHICLVSVMRAGNGMLEAILRAWPEGSVGHIGIYRDKFLNNTIEYYFKTPEHITESSVFLMDPIIATGDTAIASVERLKELGCTDISFLSLMTSATGKERLLEAHPELKLFAISTEETIADTGYVTPGIGDVGARFYNTK